MTSTKVYRGDTWQQTWTVKDSTGNPVDLTGCTARLHLRDATGVKVAEASTTDGRLTITALQGKVDLTMPAATMQLQPGAYRYDLEITWPGGIVRTHEQATLAVLEDMTRD